MTRAALILLALALAIGLASALVYGSIISAVVS